jgi:hypothetical protein
MRSNLGAGRVAHTSQGGDMILCNRKSTSSEPGHAAVYRCAVDA